MPALSEREGDGSRPNRPGRRAAALVPGLAFLAVLACGPASGGEGPSPRVVERLAERSKPASCAPLPDPSGVPSVVEELVATSDSTFLALHPLDRRIVHYRDDLVPLFETRFEKDGPVGVEHPRSVALVEDTLLYVADLAGRRIKVLDREGRDRGTIRLPVAPNVVRASRDRKGGSRVYVAAFPMGGSRNEPLVHVLEEATTRPVAVSRVPFGDLRVEALANLIEITPMADGRVIAAHQLVTSRAYLIDPSNRGFVVRESSIPVSRAVARRLGEVPDELFEREKIAEIAAPVLSAGSDRASGDYLYLTRTGRPRRGGGTEKAIVRASRDLEYRRSWVLDINAQQFVYLAGTRSAIVIDDEASWYRCALR